MREEFCDFIQLIQYESCGTLSTEPVNILVQLVWEKWIELIVGVGTSPPQPNVSRPRTFQEQMHESNLSQYSGRIPGPNMKSRQQRQLLFSKEQINHIPNRPRFDGNCRT
mmetsp:Transcript_5017/g.6149  ORF Transcript_5017/g.6149 Transcript_5017/m.6149 type:complete len:110 (+) Transcript_5017:237-566(+)